MTELSRALGVPSRARGGGKLQEQQVGAIIVVAKRTVVPVATGNLLSPRSVPLSSGCTGHAQYIFTSLAFFRTGPHTVILLNFFASVAAAVAAIPVNSSLGLAGGLGRAASILG